jgi:hypothetical protein
MPDITILKDSGSSSQRVDIVFVSEGYLASERSKFLSDASTFLDYMLGAENASLNQPFSTYQNYFNGSGLFVASNESGVDTATLAVDTYFGAAERSSDGRLVYGDSAKVRSTVNSAFATNAHEITVVLVNSTKYGGSGGSIVWATTGNKSSAEILLHEIGHGFASLEDEYVDLSLLSTYPISSLDSVHLTSSLAQIPWTSWLGYTDALGTVGTFEGGYYRSTGVWRATLDSKMYHLGVAFNAPEKEAFALAYYKAIGDYLSFNSAIPGLVCAVQPDSNLLSFNWGVNGVAVPGVSQAYLDLYAAGMQGSGYSVKLTTMDSTGFIRNGLSLTTQTEVLNLSASSIIDVVTANYSLTQSNAIFRFGSDNNTIFCGSQPLQDYIDGGAGSDTLVFDAPSSNYAITNLTTGTQVISLGGTPLLAAKSVEFAKFSDVTIKLSDTTAPVVTAFTPLDEATGVSVSTDFVVSFDEPILRGFGDITLKTASGMTVAVFDAASSSNLSIKDNTLTINPSNDLSLSAGYKLEFVVGAVRDTAGNSYAGSTSYNFTTKQGVNVLSGTSASESFTSGSGNDTIDGGSGLDKVFFSGARADHTITKSATGWTVSSTADSTDALANVERLQFSDSSLAFDVTGGNSAGGIYRFYVAGLGRTPDLGGIGYYIDQVDKGLKDGLRMAIDFTYSAEFQKLYGVTMTDSYATGSNISALVTAFYTNVLQRVPDQGGLDFYINKITVKEKTVGQVLAEICDSNEIIVKLAGAIENGVPFIPYGG